MFGAFLLFTAFKIARHHDAEVHPDDNPVLKLVRRVVPSTTEYDGQKLFTRRTGRRLATPLFAVLVLIETTDVVFAVDSIPAILAVSREPFIVFASNAFAILGLRALYFCLAGMADRFRYLNPGLGVILAFVGLKMLLVDVVHLPTWLSLGVIAVVLAVTIVASLRAERQAPPHADDCIPDLALDIAGPAVTPAWNAASAPPPPRPPGGRRRQRAPTARGGPPRLELPGAARPAIDHERRQRLRHLRREDAGPVFLGDHDRLRRACTRSIASQVGRKRTGAAVSGGGRGAPGRSTRADRRSRRGSAAGAASTSTAATVRALSPDHLAISAYLAGPNPPR